MIVRKLDPGDARGLIMEVEEFSVSRWDSRFSVYLNCRTKGSESGGDGCSVFEILPLGTPLTTWDDQEYIEWIKIHDRHRDSKDNMIYCEMCGSEGFFTRSKNGDMSFNSFVNKA